MPVDYTCDDIEQLQIQLDSLESQLDIYELELSGLQNDLALLQTDLSEANSLLDQYNSNLENQKSLLFEKQVEKANAEANIRKINNDLAFLKLKLANLINEKADILSYIQSQPETMSLWCADYTLDLAGQVGIADVPGEMNAMQIRQGYTGRAVYNSARDGILQHAKAGSIANTWIQACVMPAVRKWKPQYRHGTITAINYDNDTCSIKLAEATSQYLTTVFDINQTYELHNIPIEYMECNSAVFVLGDKVLIEYPDRKTPKVVGFFEYPRKCEAVTPPLFLLFGNSEKKVTITYTSGTVFEPGQTLLDVSDGTSYGAIRAVSDTILYGDFTGLRAEDNVYTPTAVANVTDCRSLHFREKYTRKQLRSAFIKSDFEDENLIMASDFSSVTDVECSAGVVYQQVWHKTCNNVTLCAFSYRSVGDMNTQWGVVATYNGEAVKIGGYSQVDGYIRAETDLLNGGLKYYHIGFDVWQENGKYMMSLCGKSRILKVFELNEAHADFVNIESYNGNDPGMDDNTKLVGLGKRQAFYLNFGAYGYWEQNSGDVVVKFPFGEAVDINDAVWDAVNREIKFVVSEHSYYTSIDPVCQFLTLGATAYFGRPLYCSVYSYQEYSGYRCEPIDFGCVSGPLLNKQINAGCIDQTTVSYFIGASSCLPSLGRPSWVHTYNDIAISGDTTQKHILGSIDICGNVFDRGDLVISEDGHITRFVLDQNGTVLTGVFLDHDFCIPSDDCFSVENIKLIAGADGTISGTWDKRQYLSPEFELYGAYTCEYALASETSEHIFGDTTLAGLASEFPHDQNIKAWLIDTVDCASNSVTNTIIYTGVIDNWGIVSSSADYLSGRVAFTKFDPVGFECD